VEVILWDLLINTWDGALFEQSNQATAGSPRIGKGSPNERKDLRNIMNLSAAPKTVAMPRAACASYNVERKDGWMRGRQGIPLPVISRLSVGPDDITRALCVKE